MTQHRQIKLKLNPEDTVTIVPGDKTKRKVKLRFAQGGWMDRETAIVK